MQVRRQFFDRQNADVILKIDDQDVQTADDINNIVGERKPGDEVIVTILRAGREAVLRVRLGSE
jgi:S1-C subfamily serine protease